jgi:hypothetical protein
MKEHKILTEKNAEKHDIKRNCTNYRKTLLYHFEFQINP